MFSCNRNVNITCNNYMLLVNVMARVVQTELPEQEYALLQKAVAKKKVTVKQGVREAIQQWVCAQIPLAEDPLFRVKPVKTGIKTDSTDLDRSLYERGQR